MKPEGPAAERTPTTTTADAPPDSDAPMVRPAPQAAAGPQRTAVRDGSAVAVDAAAEALVTDPVTTGGANTVPEDAVGNDGDDSPPSSGEPVGDTAIDGGGPRNGVDAHHPGDVLADQVPDGTHLHIEGSTPRAAAGAVAQAPPVGDGTATAATAAAGAATAAAGDGMTEDAVPGDAAPGPNATDTRTAVAPAAAEDTTDCAGGSGTVTRPAADRGSAAGEAAAHGATPAGAGSAPTPSSDAVASYSPARAIERVLALAEQLEAAPPPRTVAVDLEDLGGQRVLVALRGRAITVAPVAGQTLDAGFSSDLARSFAERGLAYADASPGSGSDPGDHRGGAAHHLSSDIEARPDPDRPRARRGFAAGRPAPAPTRPDLRL